MKSLKQYLAEGKTKKPAAKKRADDGRAMAYAMDRGRQRQHETPHGYSDDYMNAKRIPVLQKDGSVK
jgi:hypothetical protein